MDNNELKKILTSIFIKRMKIEIIMVLMMMKSAKLMNNCGKFNSAD